MTRFLLEVLLGTTLLLAALLLYLGPGESVRLEQAAAGYRGRAIETGAELYHLHCRLCHGIRGEGVGQLGPPLSDRHFFLKRLSEVGWQFTLSRYVASTIEYGRMMGTRPIYAGNGSSAVMPPWHQRLGGVLRGDEVAALTAFVLNWQATASGKVTLPPLEIPPEQSPQPELIARGSRVFQEQCSGCHRYQAMGSHSTGPDLTEISGLAGSRKAGMEPLAYIRESILVPDSFLLEGYRPGRQYSCGSTTLTRRELDAVSAFLLQ
ncbi:cytochrome c [Desulfogranum mediterraneum]|uniref:cytochrome c n=1 Tax=Desulfogranum mediterraneum TaxID=160661 RepID=UPI00041CAEB4|nr:cytochrome c [Desulfogranum mediterraneum]